MFVVNENGRDLVQLTHDFGMSSAPGWSPDGERIAFQRATLDPSLPPPSLTPSDLYVMNSDGTGGSRLTNTPTVSETNPDWGTS